MKPKDYKYFLVYNEKTPCLKSLEINFRTIRPTTRVPFSTRRDWASTLLPDFVLPTGRGVPGSFLPELSLLSPSWEWGWDDIRAGYASRHMEPSLLNKQTDTTEIIIRSQPMVVRGNKSVLHDLSLHVETRTSLAIIAKYDRSYVNEQKNEQKWTK